MAGAQVNVGAGQPPIDKTVAEQLARAGERIRRTLLQEERGCNGRRSPFDSLQGTGIPLTCRRYGWVRPTRAVAAQPRVDSSSVIAMASGGDPRDAGADQRLSFGHAHVVPPTPGGLRSACRSTPFTELSKIVRRNSPATFPKTSGSVGVTVQHASIAASGNRLLISLWCGPRRRRAFGFAGEVPCISGPPVLDRTAYG